jgi:hypothetical protein
MMMAGAVLPALVQPVSRKAVRRGRADILMLRRRIISKNRLFPDNGQAYLSSESGVIGISAISRDLKPGSIRAGAVAERRQV